MTEKENLLLILNTLNKLEIRGFDNILTMYNLISFIKKEIERLSLEEKNNT
jgi:hypothetical protein